jgi:ABC-2 type transport system ATP-binding protein
MLPGSTERATALSVRGLAKRYGALDVLAGVDLEIAAGERFGLVGVNGAGKTTLIKCVLDLCGYESGAIEIFGVPSRVPAARRRLFYVPERFVPPYYLRGREFIAQMLALSGAPLERARADSLLQELEIAGEVLDRPVRQLSKGMTQKLGLAACFLVERDLYVLDEPMSGLDPASRVAVKSVLRRLGAERRTVVFTSHVLSEVEELCQSIAVLDRSRIRFRGGPAELCVRYGEPDLERAFIRCIRSEHVEPARGSS